MVVYMTDTLSADEQVKRVYSGWIGVDLDGTLAEYHGWQGPRHIGKPIPKMVERVKRWLKEGKQVKIFTARVSHDGSTERVVDALSAHLAIVEWCIGVFGHPLQITNVKDYAMHELWDDRAVQVRQNTGERMDNEPEGEPTP
jgi:hypothetical protein